MILSLIAAASISASCVWGNPRGTYAVTAVKPSALVDNYQDIPASVRQRIKARMDALKYDEVVEIRKGSIKGDYAYSGLRDMHFGASGGRVCREVSLANWTPTEAERALIYCEGGHCLAVPTVCRNVSRITRGQRLVTPPVDPLPVAVPVGLPDVEPGPVVDTLPPQSFARLSVPGLPPDLPPFGQQDLSTPEPDRVGSGWSFYDLWARPLFGPVERVVLVTEITPPVVTPIKPPVIGDAIVIPAPGSPEMVLPKEPQVNGLPSGDGLPVAPIPEPAEWVMMIVGLLMVTRWVRSAR